MIEAPEGHYLIEDDYSMNYSDIGGAKWYFVFADYAEAKMVNNGKFRPCDVRSFGVAQK